MQRALAALPPSAWGPDGLLRRSDPSSVSLCIFGFADVDGTLIESDGDKANWLHKEAFKHGFKTVFGLDTHIDVVKHHGGTDPLLILKVRPSLHMLGARKDQGVM